MFTAGTESRLDMPQQSPHPSGRVVSVRLDPDTEARLNALAERTGRSRGVYIRLALQAALPQLEREHWNQLVKRSSTVRGIGG